MPIIVQASETKEKYSELLQKVRGGESFSITLHGTESAGLVAACRPSKEQVQRTIADNKASRSVLNPSGRPKRRFKGLVNEGRRWNVGCTRGLVNGTTYRSTWAGGMDGQRLDCRGGASRGLAAGRTLPWLVVLSWVWSLGPLDLAKAATRTPGLVDESYHAEFLPGERPKRIVALRDGSVFALLDWFNTDLNRFPLVLRFLPNGDRDPGYRAPVLGLSETHRIESMEIGQDWNVFLGGWMDSKLQGNGPRQEGQRRAALRCLKPDGTWNDEFNANAPDFEEIDLIHPLEDGGVWISGKHREDGPRVLTRLDAKGMVINRGWSVERPGWFGVRSMVNQSDGKWVIAGEIRCSEMLGIVGLARLHPDGGLDASFLPQPQPPKGVSLALVRSAVGLGDGSILASGVFVGVGTHSTLSLARLLDSGEPDVRFRVRSIDNFVEQAWGDSDGRILIRGSFGKVGGFVRRGFARLLFDGTLDTGYAVELPDTDLVEIVEASQEGIPHLAVLRQELGRPHTSFVVRLLAGASPASAEPAFARQPSGGAYRVGAAHEFAPVLRCPIGTRFLWEQNEVPLQGATNAFLSLPRLGTSHSGTYRLHLSSATGSTISGPAYLVVEPTIAAPGWPDLSTRFNGGPNGMVRALLNLPDGRVLVGGRFGCFGERFTGAMAILDGNGDVEYGLTNSFIALGSVEVLELDPDGRVLAAGSGIFSTSTGVRRRSLARLNADGTLDPGFDARLVPGSSVDKVVCLADGSYLVAGRLVFDWKSRTEVSLVRLLPNGTRDPGYVNPFWPDAGRPEFLRLDGGRVVALHALQVPT